ncbi:hypothetical protein Amet_0807 [Alkaliphilus metalliredigens QYMF]|uniref:Uncharacterized protein n=1 Tax=Alkaliphilus metalliredigens (strain QYMF) TaxID=293826 RepID=A6TLG4_ALKMQ|nr:hypothetical protein [Alkaliphilus metalliredigens]ABR47032.1 hypothetical protein Amet_0807 [Alkaliphilus metalliredigens QYMF]
MPRRHRRPAPTRKTYSQKLGEMNVMPDGMLEAIDATDLAILAIEQGARGEQTDRQDQQT